MNDPETIEWRRHRESWYAWEEPWFRRAHPTHYFFLSRGDMFNRYVPHTLIFLAALVGVLVYYAVKGLASYFPM